MEDEDILKDEIKSVAIEKFHLDSQADKYFLDDIAQEIAKRLKWNKRVNREDGILMRSVIPHCTVYLLKNGRCLWRQESS